MIYAVKKLNIELYIFTWLFQHDTCIRYEPPGTGGVIGVVNSLMIGHEVIFITKELASQDDEGTAVHSTCHIG